MTQEQTFRLVAAALMLVGGPVGAYHRIRARQLGAKVTGVDEPRGIRVVLKLSALAGLLILVLWFVRPVFIEWARVPLAGWMRWVGAAIALSAVPLLGWTLHTLGHNLTDTVATRANSYLVTTGPYRWVRHPFYVTVAIFCFGFSLLCALWPIALVATAILALLAMRTPLEERKLIDRFGNAYVEYAARTGRYLPRRKR